MSWSDYDAALPAEGVVILSYPFDRPDIAPVYPGKIDYYARFEGQIYNLCTEHDHYTLYVVSKEVLAHRQKGSPPEAEHFGIDEAEGERILRSVFADQLMELTL